MQTYKKPYNQGNMIVHPSTKNFTDPRNIKNASDAENGFSNIPNIPMANDFELNYNVDNGNNYERKEVVMDFQKYIDHLEQDRREMEKRLADDAKEREEHNREERAALEKRLADDAKEREERLAANIEKMEERNREERAALEKRLADDAKEREQRLNASIAQTNAKIDSLATETKTAHKWLIGIIIGSIVSATGVILNEFLTLRFLRKLCTPRLSIFPPLLFYL